jgi:hypothetical protein
MTAKTARELERDLIEHARDQLSAAARRHVRGGMGPESAASAAIRETKALFPPDWKLSVQGDDDDEFVEVWEVEHKYGAPIAKVHAAAPEPPPKLTASQRTVLAILALTSVRGHVAVSAAEQRTLAKLVEYGLATARGARYYATEAGLQAHYDA